MSLTMTCLRCGASCTGAVDEVLAWDAAHEELCPNKVEEKRA
jgi:hypothetical protein